MAQGQRLWHVSNLFQIPQAETLAAAAGRSDLRRFRLLHQFRNGGARRRGEDGAQISLCQRPSREDPHHHARKARFTAAALAALAAGGNPKYLEGFEPRLDGFDQVPFGDLDALKAAIGPRTGAILVEPIQGEGGVRVLPQSFLEGIRAPLR